MTSQKHDRQQPTQQFWTPLPDNQQELLSGGSPRITTTTTSTTSGTPPTGSRVLG